jgi:hypothetical protein
MADKRTNESFDDLGKSALPEPDPLPLPDWPEGQPEAASDEGGSSWGERWRDNAARREEWFAARRGEDAQRFEVRGGEVVPPTTEQPTAGGESSAEILKRIERQLSSIADMMRQMT